MYTASPPHARSLFLSITGATPGRTMGRLSTAECTYLPTYLDRSRKGQVHALFFACRVSAGLRQW